MARSGLARGLFVALIASLLLSTPAAAEAPVTVRIDSTDATAFPLVTASVTVRNEFGVPVSGLTVASFDVSEDRDLQPRPIEAVQPLVNPDAQVSVVLALDISGSMEGAKLRDAQEAARRFLDRLNAADRTALLAFATSIDLAGTDPGREAAFTADKAALYDVIGRLQAGGATPLYDAAYKAVQWAGSQPAGNRAVLLFTDGREEKAADGTGGSRVANDDSPVREANRAGVPIFTIGLGADVDEAYLRRVALEAGGTYQHAAGSAELGALFANVSDLLKQQYRITYRSAAPADGAQHRLLLAVRVGENSAFHEASFGPVPFVATGTPAAATAVPATPSPVPSPTPLPPTAVSTAEPAAVVPPLSTPAVTGSSVLPLGISPLGWGAAGLGVVLVAGLLAVGARGRKAAPTVHRCLRCGHALPEANATCPSCGYHGRSYRGE